MPVYIYEGLTRSGDTKTGELTAKSEAEVADRLRQQNISVSKIKKKPKQLSFSLPSLGGVDRRTMVIFTRQFATMIDAGLPLVQCLDILSSQEPNKSFQKVLYSVKDSVESGSTFADSLSKHPKVFDSLFVNLIAAGEIGGILDTIMNRLATHIEKADKLARKVKSAFTYPATMMVIAILVVIVLLWKVIPTFQNMFSDMGDAALPGPTQFVIDLSDNFLANWYVYIGAIVGAVFLFSTFKKTTFGREFWDTFILKVPLFGSLVRKSAVAKFTRTLGTMMSSGVPILDGLDIVSRGAGNKRIEDGILYVREKISEGRTMAEPLAETKLFPSMVVQMIAVGESTGAMDVMLNKIADFYEEEVDLAVEGLTSMLEPLMMVVIGGLVGGLLIAMYLPIFTVADVAG